MPTALRHGMPIDSTSWRFGHVGRPTSFALRRGETEPAKGVFLPRRWSPTPFKYGRRSADQSGTGVSPVRRNFRQCFELAITGETPVPLLSRQVVPRHQMFSGVKRDASWLPEVLESWSANVTRRRRLPSQGMRCSAALSCSTYGVSTLRQPNGARATINSSAVAHRVPGHSRKWRIELPAILFVGVVDVRFRSPCAVTPCLARVEIGTLYEVTRRSQVSQPQIAWPHQIIVEWGAGRRHMLPRACSSPRPASLSDISVRQNSRWLVSAPSTIAAGAVTYAMAILNTLHMPTHCFDCVTVCSLGTAAENVGHV